MSDHSRPLRNEEALAGIVLKMTSSLDLREVLGMVTSGLVADLDAAVALIWMVESDELESGNRSSAGLRLASSAGLSLPPSGPIPDKVRWIAQERDHYCTPDVPLDGSAGSASWIREHRLRSLGGYPLIFRDALVGVLAIYTQRHLSRPDFERLFLFAQQAAVAIQNARLYAQVERLKDRLEVENRFLQNEVERDHNCGEIVGSSPAIRQVRSLITRVAPTDSTVLIGGETGTGKELVAVAIHRASRRRDRAMVKVNCAAIASGLVESELFGHEKGAFTGAAQRRIGRFELADGGTLFLDEVGELPADVQVKVLRAIQEQEFERVGGTQPIRVDTRIIAATNRDLAAEVAAGRFRADLFYRLNVFPIQVPPLRERIEDVPMIAHCVLGLIETRIDRRLAGLTASATDRLRSYHWPGNVRELINILERAAILSNGPQVDVATVLATNTEGPAPATVSGTLRDVERQHIEQTLERTGWVVEGADGAAAILGLPASTLRSRMLKLGIQRS